MSTQLVRSIGLVAVAVVVFWALAAAVGFEFSLVSSLIASVVLTLLLNLGVRAFRRSST